MTTHPTHMARREALKRIGALGATATTPLALNLMSMAAASAQTATDYKSLVCVFLLGGNDNANTVIPVSNAEYSAYATGRLALALPNDASLRTIAPLDWSGPTLALHPSLTNLQQLFNTGKAGLISNIGTLTEPLTKAQWNDGSPTVSAPAQLFSHSDQQSHWQTGIPEGHATTGWMGRMGDVLAPSFNASSNVSITMSVAGNQIMLAGDQTVQYQITSRGPLRIRGLDDLFSSGVDGEKLRRILTAPSSHVLENELAKINARAMSSESIVSAAVAPVIINTAFPTQSGLAAQLKMVARLIGARQALGQRRQMFIVTLGGFDHHDELLTDHALRLGQLDAALKSFYDATVELGVADTTTTFTASEFGRSLLSNGRGSDHGWGGHQFIMGGAVRGQRVYGKWPTVALNSADDSGQGRLIPTTSVDQFAASLATWLGVSATNMPLVVPNVNRFATGTMNFFA